MFFHLEKEGKNFICPPPQPEIIRLWRTQAADIASTSFVDATCSSTPSVQQQLVMMVVVVVVVGMDVHAWALLMCHDSGGHVMSGPEEVMSRGSSSQLHGFQVPDELRLIHGIGSPMLLVLIGM